MKLRVTYFIDLDTQDFLDAADKQHHVEVIARAIRGDAGVNPDQVWDAINNVAPSVKDVQYDMRERRNTAKEAARGRIQKRGTERSV